jgi:cellobiose phosphorylase
MGCTSKEHIRKAAPPECILIRGVLISPHRNRQPESADERTLPGDKDGIIEYDFFYEPWTFHYMASNFEPDSFDSVRDSFLGNYHTETDPEAVRRGECFTASSWEALRSIAQSLSESGETA